MSAAEKKIFRVDRNSTTMKIKLGSELRVLKVNNMVYNWYHSE